MDKHEHDDRRHAVAGFVEQRKFSRSAPDACDYRARAAPAPLGRRFPREAANERDALRIWEIDPDALQLVLDVLLTRPELEACFASLGDAPVEESREDALRVKAAVRCTRPCAFAERVEAVLSERASELLPLPPECPMIALAERWHETREALGGSESAAFLWHLASDGRPHLEPLTNAVRGDLWTRAMRLLRDDRGAAGRPGAL
jgi:hypothetical protein